MRNELLPVMVFILITTFSPGPSNVAGAAMGVLYGYRNTLKFLLGMSGGFFLLMFFSAWASASLLDSFPALASLLRYVGAAYILYLALGMFKASYTFDPEAVKPMGFTSGLLLQLLNPKLVVYGLTLFSTFFAPMRGQLDRLAVAVILLALTAFCATSVWTLFGTLLKTYLRQPPIQLAVNAVLSLSLVYSALELAGITNWLLG
ncbi:MAG: lysine transporter LysE [Chloroflexi bacterium]|nr:MAG: lysine transporter LysE [Chloroflexota bacterium]